MSGMDRLTFNEWFTSLEKGRQAVLRDDKWMLADAAFQAGRASQAAPAPSALVKALRTAEAALSDIGDAEREEGDDLAWCEGRAAKALPLIRPVLRAALITTPAPSDGLREAVDAAWNDAIEAAEKAALDRQGRRVMGDGHSNSCYDIGVSDAANAIRALRRAAPTEGEA